MKNRLLAGLIFPAMVLTGCNQRVEQTPLEKPQEIKPEQVKTEQHSAGINWYQGSVDQAFAEAQATGKPLFLYWGAVWCPPCNVLKATVFQEPEFIDTTNQFVSVYLDGDTERAQQYGDQFAIAGYPTVLLFNPGGEEVTRIPGGTPPEDYRQLLELVLKSDQTVADSMNAVLRGDTISSEQWHQLAWYAWDQDSGKVLEARDPLVTFEQLASACPDDLQADATRLKLLAMLEWLKNPLGSGQQYIDALHRVINDEAMSRANLSLLTSLSSEQLRALTAGDGQERFKLLVNLVARLQRMGDPELLSATERLSLVSAKIAIEKANDPHTPLPEVLIDEVRAAVAEEDKRATTHYQRQSVISSASYLLDDAGLEDESTALLMAEVEKSEAPYYFMSMLSYRAMKKGDYENGMNWSRKAWDSAVGAATRSQWGTNHLLNLIKGAPVNIELIDGAQHQLLEEMATAKSSVFGRTRGRMIRLNTALEAWAEGKPERQGVWRQFQTTLKSICDAQNADCSFLHSKEA
ncbi:thioredoxin family protein [Porticoccaceae bacterium LTM1]|nr:thioredoxin family protein [Porticoccaceae bacterium LTM1]